MTVVWTETDGWIDTDDWIVGWIEADGWIEGAGEGFLDTDGWIETEGWIETDWCSGFYDKENGSFFHATYRLPFQQFHRIGQRIDKEEQ